MVDIVDKNIDKLHDSDRCEYLNSLWIFSFGENNKLALFNLPTKE